jgi:Lrp/AsnC family transcriptional regulator, leucine-responsive regulatory protein
MPVRLDDKDKIIVSMYSADPDVSQDSIAKVLKLSQPSVAARVARLKGSGALETNAGVNPLKMGLYLAKVDLASTRPNDILDMFVGCPYFANGFSVSGRHNLCLFFFSESVTTLEAIVNGHIRSDPSVSDVDFDIVIASVKDFIIPVTLRPEHSSTPPCGIGLKCSACPAFKGRRCMGCPVTGEYQGSFY